MPFKCNLLWIRYLYIIQNNFTHSQIRISSCACEPYIRLYSHRTSMTGWLTHRSEIFSTNGGISCGIFLYSLSGTLETDRLPILQQAFQFPSTCCQLLSRIKNPIYLFRAPAATLWVHWGLVAREHLHWLHSALLSLQTDDVENGLVVSFLCHETK